MKMCQLLTRHFPPNHNVERVMASLHSQNAPQGMFEWKSGSYTAPRWWKISHPWRCFHACSQCATGGDALLLSVRSPSKQEQGGVPLSRGALSHVDRPWWSTTWLCRYVQHMILFPERISANPLPYCFGSGFSPHTFQPSWPSPVFNTPELRITFNCPIDEISQNFQWFQESENLRIWFSAFVKGNHSHAVFVETPLHVNAARDMSKLP